jgi:hypothetical protein
MALVRVYREGDSWGLIRRYTTDTYSFDDIPSPIKEKLAVLIVAPDGFRDERIGRKINDDTYWVFNRGNWNVDELLSDA